ncbi:citrate lyase beta subunit [bacterium]|nr:citrate lyase beta subunit [bacterium]
METNLSKMVSILVDLRDNYHATGLKAEFEAEGTRYEDALILKYIALDVGLDFVIKLGGCGALRDMYDSEKLGANAVVAPMIESPYAVNKFINTANNVIQKDTELWINIETKYGFDYLDEIFEAYAKDLTGVVLGRSDLTGSLETNDVNGKEILNYAKILTEKTSQYNKKLIIGGGVSPSSIPFFKTLPEFYAFETRKVIFDTKALKNVNIENGIRKALEFELLWLKNKEEFLKEDENRIKILEQRGISNA